jgi:hypothetical protein
MNTDEIIRMAQEVGIFTPELMCATVTLDMVERLIQVAQVDEREACARVCEKIDEEYEGEDVLATWCAAAIRARGNA